MSAAASRNVASAPSSSSTSTGFTSEEDLFFETGKAMEAVMQEDAAAEAWEDEILGARNRRKGLLKPALRLGLVVAAAVGLFVIGGLLMTGTTSANDAARTIVAKFR
jgi:hypothetical protein